MDKILANDTFDKGLVSKIYKEKWAEVMNKHFSKGLVSKIYKEKMSRSHEQTFSKEDIDG